VEGGRGLPPALEVADDVHAVRVGRPDREVDARAVVAARQVSAELFVDARVGPFGEQVEVDVAEAATVSAHGRRL